MIRVLVVDDETTTAEAHAAYVSRIDGFEVAGVAHTGSDAVRMLRSSLDEPSLAIDLVLLDMNLPDRSGLDVCRSIRAAGLAIDIIAITAVRELPVVRQAIAVGVVQYLIKPFTFAAFLDKLTSYATFRETFHSTDHPDAGSARTTQAEVDSALAALRRSSDPVLPKGLSIETLGLVRRLLEEDRTWSSSELSDRAGLSRVTARRYLEHLAEVGDAAREPRHGGSGRPEIEYRRVR